MTRLMPNICERLTLTICKKCANVGVKTVTDFLLSDAEDLSKNTGIPFKEISYIRCALLDIYSSVPQRADNVFDAYLECNAIISTGCSKLDKYLYGGIYTGEIIEIYGKLAAGKTQFSFSLAATLIAESSNTALYIDTNSSFSAKRIEEIFKNKIKNNQVNLEKLKLLRVINVDDIYNFLNMLEKIKSELNKKENEFYKYMKLIIIDSITHIISPCFISSYLDGLGLMSTVSLQLHEICYKYKIAILMINNIKNDSQQKILEANWKYIPAVRLFFDMDISKTEKIRKKRKIVTMKSCHWVPPQDFYFTISEEGISDVNI